MDLLIFHDQSNVGFWKTEISCQTGNPLFRHVLHMKYKISFKKNLHTRHTFIQIILMLCNYCLTLYSYKHIAGTLNHYKSELKKSISIQVNDDVR